MDGTVLIADDDRAIRTVLTRALTRAGCRVHATSSLATLMRWVEEGKGDLVISDVVMPDGDGIEQLPLISAMRPGLPVIVISARNTIMTAIQAAEKDAFDYLPKPFDLPDLLARAARGLETRRRAPRMDPGLEADKEDSDLPLVGVAPAMQELYRLVARVMNTDLPALITGETGTGKSLIARAIHDYSDRRNSPFLIVGAADLLSADSPGEIPKRAEGGTVLFDEIGDFDGEAQGGAARMMDVAAENPPRFLATTLRDIGRALEEGRIRRDLFGRLSGLTIAVPPLRQRVDDIPLLAGHFLDRAARGGGPPRRLSDGAADLARTHSWPGNVRQLENTMRRLAVTSKEATIDRAELEQALEGQSLSGDASVEGDTGNLAAEVRRHLRRHFDAHGGELPPVGLHRRVVREIEAPLIEISLEATDGHMERCAELLGLNRNTLRKKIAELGIGAVRRRR